jgi:hypothetical protein
LALDLAPDGELHVGTGRSGRPLAASAGCRVLGLRALPLLDGHAVRLRGEFRFALLLLLCNGFSRSVVIWRPGRGLFFVARYAGDGLAPSPL